MVKVRLVVAGVAAGAMLALPGLASASTPTWHVQKTASPTSFSEFDAVACPSATECVAVGEAPKGSNKPEPLAETWNGKTWKTDRLPLPKAFNSTGTIQLNGVSCASTRICLAVGEYLGTTTQYAFSELWKGGRWTEHDGARISADSAAFNGVSCPSATACIAVGTYVQGTTGGPLSEEWQGSHWTLIKSAAINSVDALFNGVSCSSVGRCTAVGSVENSSGTELPLMERLRKGAWVVQHGPTVPSKGLAELASVSCPTTSACVAVGQNYASSGLALAEAWNGKTWKLLTTPRLSGKGDAELNGVSCTGPTTCRAVGGRNAKAEVSKALAESWSGGAWKVQSTADPSSNVWFTGVACTAGPVCSAAGIVGGTSRVSPLIERN